MVSLDGVIRDGISGQELDLSILLNLWSSLQVVIKCTSPLNHPAPVDRARSYTRREYMYILFRPMEYYLLSHIAYIQFTCLYFDVIMLFSTRNRARPIAHSCNRNFAELCRLGWSICNWRSYRTGSFEHW